MTLRRAVLVVPLLAAAIIAILIGLSSGSAPKKARTGPLAMFEEDGQVLAQPRRTLQTLRSLGVDVVRLNVKWASIAPDAGSRTPPTDFDASDPAAYPPGNWARFDRAVRAASADGTVLDFLVTGEAPLWATSPGAPPPERSSAVWDPSPTAYAQFVEAVATRYSGSYKPPGASTPLPRVHFWEIW